MSKVNTIKYITNTIFDLQQIIFIFVYYQFENRDDNECTRVTFNLSCIISLIII